MTKELLAVDRARVARPAVPVKLDTTPSLTTERVGPRATVRATARVKEVRQLKAPPGPKDIKLAS